MKLAKREPLSRDLRVLLAANFVSALGSGLTMPFLLIYLHEVRHLSLGLTGGLIGASAVVAIPVGPWAGSLVDRFGPRVVCALAMVFEAVSTVLLVFVRSPVSALPVLLLVGIGGGASWPSWSALFAVVVSDDALKPRVFARSFQLLNLGLGVGSVIAGTFVRVTHPITFETIYVLDAVSFGAVVLALCALPARVFARGDEASAAVAAVDPASRGGYREVLADKRFVRYMIASWLLLFAGYSAINAGFVGYATVVVHVQPYVIAWAFAANTAIIVLIQPLGLRLSERMRRSTALSVCSLIWASSWVLLFVASHFAGQHIGEGLVVAMFAMFSLGEVLLSPVSQPLVAMMARPGLEGRYMAASSSLFSFSGVIGPALAGAMLGSGLGDAFLGLLVACGLLAVVGFQWMRRCLTPEIDNAVRATVASGPKVGTAA